MHQSILGARLCKVQQRANKSHYQSKVFVYVSNNHADAVDQLLINFELNKHNNKTVFSPKACKYETGKEKSCG